MDLGAKAEALSGKAFLGGPAKDFERVGRQQLIVLLEEGLYPDSRLLDIGCGSLRGGWWLINFLRPERYFGIEPNQEMLEAGLESLVGEDLLAEKRPQFDHGASFDASVFEVEFDFFLARSVWTHASKAQILAMLDSFVTSSADAGVFLTSYLPSGVFRNRDYRGEGWVGRSHESESPGLVHHSRRWVEGACRKRGLQVRELEGWVHNRQVWLRIERETAAG